VADGGSSTCRLGVGGRGRGWRPVGVGHVVGPELATGPEPRGGFGGDALRLRSWVATPTARGGDSGRRSLGSATLAIALLIASLKRFAHCLRLRLAYGASAMSKCWEMDSNTSHMAAVSSSIEARRAAA